MYNSKQFPGLNIDTYLYFHSLLSWECLRELAIYINDQCKKIMGASCSFDYDNRLDYREQTLPYWPFLKLSNLNLTGDHFKSFQGVFLDLGKDDGVSQKHFMFDYFSTESLNSVENYFTKSMIKIQMYFQNVSVQLSCEILERMMKHLVCFLTERGCTIVYGCVEPNRHILSCYDYANRRTPIPDDKLMGVRWGNVITQQHLGRNPVQLQKDLHDAITPHILQKIAPGVFFFRLPFDLMTIIQNSTTQSMYKACVTKALAAFMPYQVLWRKGIRKYYC